MTSFISKVVLSDFGNFDLKSALCQFDLALFKPSDFGFHHIHQPESINTAVPKRQAEFLAGRYCAALALNSMGLKNSYNVEIGQSREPLWPEGIVGSISHSGTRAATIVGSSNTFWGIGIDVENLIENRVIQKISSLVLDKFERDLVNASNKNDTLRFTYIFAVKEAFYKAVFPQVGINLGFSTITIKSVPETASGTVSFELKRSLNAKLLKGMVFEAQVAQFNDGQVRALVIIRNNPKDEILNFRD